MKKRYLFYISVCCLLAPSCFKAYDQTIVPTFPAKIEEASGVYKKGSLKWEMAVLDGLDYKGVDDSSSFSISNYLNDTVLVSLSTTIPLSLKRYKISLKKRIESYTSTTFYFSDTYTKANWYVYEEAFNLRVQIFHPGIITDSVSNATLSSYTTKGFKSDTIYIQKADMTALKQ
ncbi:MAG: hypothetical protein K2Q21_09170 [Chitinophagaceae bacterium]|nr:hypothetical protein [Chitinophagaceae bacterium]